MVKPIVPIPYLPDLLKTIVARVNAEFAARAAKEDPPGTPIELFFDYGLVSQVTRSVHANPDNFPLLWLVFNFDENITGNPAEFLNTSIQLLIMTPTENTYSMDQRDTINFKPILFPIYQELLRQIRSAVEFGKPSETDLKHTRTIRPYWGGGDLGGTDTDNLFKKYVDAVHIRNLNLRVKREC